MKKMIIEDIGDIVDNIIKIGEQKKQVVVLGYYETIAALFNILMKVTDSEFIAGQLAPYEVDGYDEAYYLEYNADEIWLGKAQWEGHDQYLKFEWDETFCEEDFAEKYIKSNGDENLTIFGFKDVHDDVPNKYGSNGNVCMDDDECGFCFCVEDGENHTKFKYRGSNKLTRDQVSKIINEYIF